VTETWCVIDEDQEPNDFMGQVVYLTHSEADAQNYIRRQYELEEPEFPSF
jgi:hypothetical protein